MNTEKHNVESVWLATADFFGMTMANTLSMQSKQHDSLKSLKLQLMYYEIKVLFMGNKWYLFILILHLVHVEQVLTAFWDASYCVNTQKTT